MSAGAAIDRARASPDTTYRRVFLRGEPQRPLAGKPTGEFRQTLLGRLLSLQLGWENERRFRISGVDTARMGRYGMSDKTSGAARVNAGPVATERVKLPARWTR
jgi:hypothetical protein